MKKPIFYICLTILVAAAFSSCAKTIEGCMDPNSTNYNPNAEKNDGSCAYPSQTKKTVCFYFTDSDNSTCGSFGITLLDQIKASNPINTFFISVHPNSTDTLFAPSGIDIASAFGVSGFPDFGVGEQSNLVTQSAVLNAITAENAETPQAGIDVDFTSTIDSLIVTFHGKFYVNDTSHYFITAYIIENNVISPQIGLSGSYNHQHVLRASTGGSGIGVQINTTSVTQNSFKIRTGIYRQPIWNMANIQVIGVLWRKNGADFEFINSNN